ncbi:MAG: hypothetical protein PHV16_01335 [Candidatus Nanoarchaeia archaeon]|nr:hypothetical protein [Candidatus Nanoarchaeia archaeon]
MDMIIAIVIFGVAIAVYYKTITNLSNQDEVLLGDILESAKLISDSLLTEGYPKNWTSENVTHIGIVTDDKINQKKLDVFLSMDYSNTKKIFGTIYDYYIFFEKSDGSKIRINNTTEGIGKPGVNSTNINQDENPKKLAKVIRIVAKNNSIARMVVYAWQ